MSYVCVYDMSTPQSELVDKNNNITSNGLRVLTPSLCKITDELNGAYELELEQPVTEDGEWRLIVENNLLSASGQLFIIYRVVSSFDENVGLVYAYARHIFYALNDRWGNSIITSAQDPAFVLGFIMDNATNNDIDKTTKEYIDGVTPYEFAYSTDLKEKSEAFTGQELTATSLTETIIGSSDSFVSVYGGEIYRNNFYFSINTRREDAKDNAFVINIGMNLTGIEKDVDFSDYLTHLEASADGLDTQYFSNFDPNIYPRTVTRRVEFNLSENSTAATLNALGKSHLARYNKPTVTITVDLKAIPENSDLKKYLPSEFKTGNTGYVYDERLEILMEMEISKTVYNVLTDEVETVEFNNDSYEYVRNSDYQNVISDRIAGATFGGFITSENMLFAESGGNRFEVSE
jgi:phage-related protein